MTLFNHREQAVARRKRSKILPSSAFILFLSRGPIEPWNPGKRRGKSVCRNSSIKRIRHSADVCARDSIVCVPPSTFVVVFTLGRSLSLVNWALDADSIHTRRSSPAQTPSRRFYPVFVDLSLARSRNGERQRRCREPASDVALLIYFGLSASRNPI